MHTHKYVHTQRTATIADCVVLSHVTPKEQNLFYPAVCKTPFGLSTEAGWENRASSVLRGSPNHSLTHVPLPGPESAKHIYEAVFPGAHVVG